MKINWLSETLFTYKEAMELLKHSHKKRLEMEDKNKWDAYVNNFMFQTFLYDTYGYMFDEVKKEIDINDINRKSYYPKVKEFLDWEIFLDRSDKLMKDILKDEFLNPEGKDNIWEIVEDWWGMLFKLLYDY